MNVFDNELVQKYFGCGCETAGCLHPQEAIIRAMEEPIRKGERYLIHANQNDWVLCINDASDCEGFHPYGLRLPGKHQPRREKCESDKYFCEQCRRDCKCTSRGPENSAPFNPLHQGPHTRPEAGS